MRAAESMWGLPLTDGTGNNHRKNTFYVNNIVLEGPAKIRLHYIFSSAQLK